MAGSTLTAAQITVLLKDRFPEDDEVWAQFNTGAPALDLLFSGNNIPKYGSMDAEGERLRIPCRTLGNPNAAIPVREGKGYPAPGNQTYAQAIYRINTFVSSFQITGLARAKAPGSAKSVRNALELEMASQKENARQMMNRYLHGDGSAELARCASASGNVVTLAAVSAGTDEAALPAGLEVHINHITTGAFPGGHPAADSTLYISSTDFTTASAPTVTLLNEDGTVPVLTGVGTSHGVYIRQAQGAGMHGFGIMCSDANPTNWGGTGAAAYYYGEIDRSVAAGAFWKAYRLNASSANISIQRHIQPTLAQIDKRIGAKFGGKLYGFCGYDVFYGLCNSLARSNRTNYNMKVKGGYDAVQYNQCIFVIDFQAPFTKLRLVSPKTTYRYVMDDWYWEDETGSMMERVSTSTGRPTNTFRLNMLTRQQMLTTQNKTHAEIYGLSATN